MQHVPTVTAAEMSKMDIFAISDIVNILLIPSSNYLIMIVTGGNIIFDERSSQLRLRLM